LEEIGALTVSAMAVVAVRVPEVPVIVTVGVPTVAVLLAVSVSTLVPVVGLVPNTAVTPLGRPDATRVTLPVNPPRSVTVMVSVAVLPWVTERLVGDAARVKPGVTFVVTVIPKLADSVRVLEVPVMVTGEVPTGAVLLAVNVNTQLPLPVMGAQPDAVTPLGMPVTVPIVTVPVNPPVSVTVIVSAAVPPWAIDRVAGEAESAKPPVCEGPMVRAMVVVAGISAPEVPVIVIVVLP
jgi:hypothetical protein